MLARRTWTYKGHHCDVQETSVSDGTSFVVYIDREFKGGESTEPRAVARAYRIVDQMSQTSALEARARQLDGKRAHVRGRPWGEGCSVGDEAWVEWRGYWRLGVVVKATPGAVVVAAMAAGKLRRVRRGHDEVVMSI